MNPKEKALELSIKMCSHLDVFKPNLASNKKALIAVNEILDTLKSCWDEQGALNMYNYYNEVKQEIEKL